MLCAFYTTLGQELLNMLCRIVTWVKVSSKSHVERKINLLSALSRIALSSGLHHLAVALLPCIVIAIPSAIKYGFATRSLETYLTALASQLTQGCDITVCALAEAIPHVAGHLQVIFLRVAATLLSRKDGNPLIGSRLLPSLLQILSAPCSAVKDLAVAASAVMTLVQSTPLQPSTNARLAGNMFWETLSLSFPDLATYVPTVQLCDQIARQPSRTAEWLAKLAATVKRISRFHCSIVTAVFLFQGSDPLSVEEAAKVLVREVEKNKSLALQLFPMVLYRLGKDSDPHTRLQLLYMLPSLGVNNLCVAMVLKTLLALWQSVALKSLVLRLMLDLWAVEPRVYEHLSKMIRETGYNSNELQIAKAYVITQICKAKASQHGEELLSLLSALMNAKHGCTAATVVALDGIWALVSDYVIDLRTTWQVVADKMVRDSCPDVLVRMCRIAALAPALHVRSQQYEEFERSVAQLVWTWAASSNKSCVVEAAYEALSQFDPAQAFTLRMLPPFVRATITIPSHMISTPADEARKAEDVLKYVPGVAWVNLAMAVPAWQAPYVQTFLNAIISREVAALPKGIYMTAVQEAKRKGEHNSDGVAEPRTFAFLPETSFLRAAVAFLQEFSKSIATVEKKGDVKSAKELVLGAELILASLGQSRPRPFPVLNWTFLKDVLEVSKKGIRLFPEQEWRVKLRHGVFCITAQQCNKSASALAFISEWLEPKKGLLTKEDELLLARSVGQLGRGLSPAVLRAFLGHLLSRKSNKPDDDAHLTALLMAVKPHLTCDYVLDSNRNAMGYAIESLAENMPADAESPLGVAFRACVADLPQKHIDRLTSPTLWWEVTDERLYRAALLRCHVAATDPDASALPWLNDMIDSAAALPGDRSHYLSVIAETLVVRSDTVESTNWLCSLLGRLRDCLQRSASENLVEAHTRQLRVRFYTDVLVLGLLVWSGVWATWPLAHLAASVSTRDALLPAALVSLQGRSDWASVVQTILSWLVSCMALLQPHIEERYHLKPSILLIASLSELNQATWNKVISVVM